MHLYIAFLVAKDLPDRYIVLIVYFYKDMYLQCFQPIVFFSCLVQGYQTIIERDCTTKEQIYFLPSYNSCS